MIRTHTFPCALPRAEADALNRESGRVYSETLMTNRFSVLGFWFYGGTHADHHA